MANVIIVSFIVDGGHGNPACHDAAMAAYLRGRLPICTHDGLTFDYTDAARSETVVLLNDFPEDAES